MFHKDVEFAKEKMHKAACYTCDHVVCNLNDVDRVLPMIDEKNQEGRRKPAPPTVVEYSADTISCNSRKSEFQ